MNKKKNKAKNKTRAEPMKSSTVSWLCSPDAFDVLTCQGYTSLSQNPEIVAGVNKIAELVGSMTIHLMENTPDGDIRVQNELSRKIDINPYSATTRSLFVQWIVKTMILKGNCIVLPQTRKGILMDLRPVPPSMCSLIPDGIWDYSVEINGSLYEPDEVLHFAVNPGETYPWKGEGYRVALKDVADSLKQAAATQKGFMQSKWKPSLIIKVDADSEQFSNPTARREILDEYTGTTEAGEPWILPAEQFQVEQVKPLTLSDLALSDMVQLDKKTVASILGIPSFVLGVGDFKREEWNNFISTKIMVTAQIIQQEMTKKILIKPEWYFRFNPRSLYNYDLRDMAAIADDQFIRGIMSGNEVRDWIGLPPLEGLNELVILENYIPQGMIGDQKKLIQNGGDGDGTESS